MRPIVIPYAAGLAAMALSCKRPAVDVMVPTDQSAVAEELSAFERTWLEPAKIPPPTVTLEPRTLEEGAVTVTVNPLRPEDAAWNAWPGPTVRLFNNRAALMFEVTVDGGGRVAWLPDRTGLELNEVGNPLPPAHTPDELLVPVLRAALLQEGYGLEGDAVERTRAAGPFRTAYLPLGPVDSPMTGVIGFPLLEPDRHVVAFRLTLAVLAPDGTHTLSFLYE
jgi:hypothetical protein